MKTNFILLLFLTVIIIVSCKSNSQTLSADIVKKPADFEKEKQAIFEVIEKETSSFYARDYNAWKNTRSQTDYEFQAWNNGNGTFDAEVGWQQVNTGIEKYIKEHPVAVTSHPKVIRKNINCRFYGDSCAFLTWDQYNSDSAVKTYTHSKDLRLMEKQNGEWKIVAVAAFWDYKNKVLADSLR